MIVWGREVCSDLSAPHPDVRKFFVGQMELLRKMRKQPHPAMPHCPPPYRIPHLTLLALRYNTSPRHALNARCIHLPVQSDACPFGGPPPADPRKGRIVFYAPFQIHVGVSHPPVLPRALPVTLLTFVLHHVQCWQCLLTGGMACVAWRPLPSACIQLSWWKPVWATNYKRWAALARPYSLLVAVRLLRVETCFGPF